MVGDFVVNFNSNLILIKHISFLARKGLSRVDTAKLRLSPEVTLHFFFHNTSSVDV